MNQARPYTLRGLGQESRPGAVDSKGSLGSRFGAVNVVEGGRVDNPLGMHLLHGPKDCVAIGDVEAGMVEGTQVVAL
jgi:hypothetical protein